MISLAILSLLGLSVLVVYLFRRSLIALLFKLPSRSHYVKVTRNIPVEMPDGIRLFCDHYAPECDDNLPTILVRTPYGRRTISFFMRRFAERGYHVIVQDVRGRFDSEGEYDPFVNEAADGKATLEWLAKEAWFNGALGTWGLSYLGYVQWAIAAEAPPFLKAMMPIMVGPQVFTSTYPDGAFGLCLRVSSTYAVHFKTQFIQQPIGKKISLLISMFLGREARKLKEAFDHLPLEEADVVVTGKRDPFYRNILEHTSAEDEFWKLRDHSAGISKVNASVYLIGGWYDLYLREVLDTYSTLKAGGKNPYLTVGPWHHAQLRPNLEGVRSGLNWFDAHLKSDYSRLREKPVWIYVAGLNEWREMVKWPPPAFETPYFLYSEARLMSETPVSTLSLDRYQYDPADPTPAVGGASLERKGAGPKDNRLLEARHDVLCYTTPPLVNDVEVIGPVRLELFVKSTLAHTDFFARLCHVDTKGRSVNVCDGLFRIEPGKGELQPDGSLRIEVDMWATAYRFQHGHCLRLQVSSGAHPRWSRNPGTGEPLGTGTHMDVAEQIIYHDAKHPSALILPILPHH